MNEISFLQAASDRMAHFNDTFEDERLVRCELKDGALFFRFLDFSGENDRGLDIAVQLADIDAIVAPELIIDRVFRDGVAALDRS